VGSTAGGLFALRGVDRSGLRGDACGDGVSCALRGGDLHWLWATRDRRASAAARALASMVRCRLFAWASADAEGIEITRTD
jgi:hypothetical protein